MEYELAVSLKEAGFPQNVWDFGLYSLAYCNLDDCCDHELHLLHNDNDEGGNVGNDYLHRQEDQTQDWVKLPTAPELIEELGDKLELLERDTDTEGTVVWRAVMTDEAFYDWEKNSDYQCGMKECCGYEYGETPEEALANLYIYIHTPRTFPIE